jgi:hypothetical protein
VFDYNVNARRRAQSECDFTDNFIALSVSWFHPSYVRTSVRAVHVTRSAGPHPPPRELIGRDEAFCRTAEAHNVHQKHCYVVDNVLR